MSDEKGKRDKSMVQENILIDIKTVLDNTDFKDDNER